MRDYKKALIATREGRIVDPQLSYGLIGDRRSYEYKADGVDVRMYLGRTAFINNKCHLNPWRLRRAARARIDVSSLVDPAQERFRQQMGLAAGFTARLDQIAAFIREAEQRIDPPQGQ